jgi:hypothetical protein
MRWWVRALFGVTQLWCWVMLGIDLWWGSKLGLMLVPVIALNGAAWGFAEGKAYMLGQVMPKMIPMVGGPSDGSEFPMLPFVNMGELRSDEHPHGSYVEQDGKLVWVEDD